MDQIVMDIQPDPEPVVRKPQKQKRSRRKRPGRGRLVVKFILGMVIMFSAGAFGFFMYVVSLLNNQLVYRDGPDGGELQVVRLSAGKQQSLTANVASFFFGSDTTLIGEDEGRVNILLLGIPGPPHPAPNLTDTMIVASIDTVNEKLSLVSIPRDMFVISQGERGARKLNGLYNLGMIRTPEDPTRLIQDAIQELSGQKMHYTVLVNLGILESAVDALGGLTIDVSERIYDPAFPGLNYSYDPFTLEAGVQTLDGSTVIKYVRSRHSVRGDFDRTKRQRQVIQALSAHARDINVLQLPTYWDILTDFHDQVATNFNPPELKRLYVLTKNLTANSIKTASLDNHPGTGLLKSTHIDVGGPVEAYALLPKEGYNEYDRIHGYFHSIFQTF